jgi:hypothetical protein
MITSAHRQKRAARRQLERPGLDHHPQAMPDHHRRLGARRAHGSGITRLLRPQPPGAVMLDTTRPSPDSVAA